MVEHAHKEALEDRQNDVAYDWQKINDIFDAIIFWYNQLLFLKQEHSDYGCAFGKVTFFVDEMQAILTTCKTACRHVNM